MTAVPVRPRIYHITHVDNLPSIVAGRRWAFSLSNARAFYAEFRSRLDQLGELNWMAVAATDFRDPDVKEGKQAPWTLGRTGRATFRE